MVCTAVAISDTAYEFIVRGMMNACVQHFPASTCVWLDTNVPPQRDFRQNGIPTSKNPSAGNRAHFKNEIARKVAVALGVLVVATEHIVLEQINFIE